MKNLTLLLCALILTFTVIFTSGISAEENTKLDNTAYLIDAEPGFPYLRKLSETGFFSTINIPAQYHGTVTESLTWNNKINIISDTKSKAGNEYAAFRVCAYDFYFRMMRIDWMIPKSDTSMQNKSIGNVLEFVLPSRESDPHEVLRKYALSPNVSGYVINFADSEKESAIAGYSLNLESPLSQSHRFFRTVFGLVAIMGVGEAWYWSNADANKIDWKYEATWHDYKRKLGDGWSLDTNSFSMNTVNHTYSGATYYMMARSNEYDVVASTLFTLAGSFVWEYAGEFREQVSLNDMVLTTLGGSILGEGLHNTSIFVENKLSKHRVIARIICFVIDPMREVNRYLDNAFREDGFTVNVIFMSPGQMLYEKTIKSKIGK